MIATPSATTMPSFTESRPPLSDARLNMFNDGMNMSSESDRLPDRGRFVELLPPTDVVLSSATSGDLNLLPASDLFALLFEKQLPFLVLLVTVALSKASSASCSKSRSSSSSSLVPFFSSGPSSSHLLFSA